MSVYRKKYLSSMVLADYALILAFYMLLAFTGIFAFKEINDLYTLNFQVGYHQCCGSGMFIPDPDLHQRISVFLTQKIVNKLSEI
jgi:hypothetical protein